MADKSIADRIKNLFREDPYWDKPEEGRPAVNPADDAKAIDLMMSQASRDPLFEKKLSMLEKYHITLRVSDKGSSLQELSDVKETPLLGRSLSRSIATKPDYQDGNSYRMSLSREGLDEKYSVVDAALKNIVRVEDEAISTSAQASQMSGDYSEKQNIKFRTDRVSQIEALIKDKPSLNAPSVDNPSLNTPAQTPQRLSPGRPSAQALIEEYNRRASQKDYPLVLQSQLLRTSDKVIGPAPDGSGIVFLGRTGGRPYVLSEEQLQTGIKSINSVSESLRNTNPDQYNAYKALQDQLIKGQQMLDPDSNMTGPSMNNGQQLQQFQIR